MRLETDRLVLRPWRAEELDVLAAHMADPQVADWLGGTLDRAQCQARIGRWQAQFDDNGHAHLALERKADGAILGMVGLSRIDDRYAATTLAGATEVGWHLARDAWGNGYASEAARAVIADGFQRLGLAEIVAFTASTNARSQGVMRRLGFARQAWRDFDHPALAIGDPLRPHVVYAVAPGDLAPASGLDAGAPGVL
jgi:RimJ/RimL family protein N-acetyltransferase